MDGDTSTNDCVIAMASGLSGLSGIQSLDSTEAQQFQACLDAVSFTPCSLIFHVCHQALMFRCTLMQYNHYSVIFRSKLHVTDQNELYIVLSNTFLHLSFCPPKQILFTC